LEEKVGKVILDNLPPMSASAKETTVKVLPWVLIVLGALGLLAALTALSAFGSGMMRFAMMTGVHLSFYDMALLVIAPITSALPIIAGYFMLSRQLRGWRIAFYSLIISVFFHFFAISIIGLVLDCLFVYLLFQIKESYS
jgi:MFS family permease